VTLLAKYGTTRGKCAKGNMVRVLHVDRVCMYLKCRNIEPYINLKCRMVKSHEVTSLATTKGEMWLKCLSGLCHYQHE